MNYELRISIMLIISTIIIPICQFDKSKITLFFK